MLIDRYEIYASLQELFLWFRQRINAAFDYRWNHFPFGKTIRGSREEYSQLHQQASSSEFREIDLLEERTGFAIEREWLDNLALHTQIVIKESSLFYHHGRLLYSVLRDHISSNGTTYITALETGSARGFSALCMAKAITDANVDGVVLSVDLLPHFREQYWNCIDDHDGPRTRAQLLEPWSDLLRRCVFMQGDTYLLLPRLGLERINMAFLDAQHIEKNVLYEFALISRRQKKGDLVVFDDVSRQRYPGVVRAVERIEETFDYEITWMPLDGDRGFAWAVHR